MKKKTELTYVQKMGSKHIKPILEKYGKTEEKVSMGELQRFFTDVTVACLNDLDKRLRKLEEEKNK